MRGGNNVSLPGSVTSSSTQLPSLFGLSHAAGGMTVTVGEPRGARARRVSDRRDVSGRMGKRSVSPGSDASGSTVAYFTPA
jgi:hypothetical protein